MYLDNAATTKVHEEVIKEVCKYFNDTYGNPSSSHTVGQVAKANIDDARRKIAQSINCKSHEIIFTSGGSESNNLAIKGFAMSHDGYIYITSGIEHKSVLQSFHAINKEDEYFIKLVVDEEGFVNLYHLENICKMLFNDKKHLKPFVSIQMANSEVGTIQNIKEIGEIVHKYRGVFHVDAVQAYGSVDIDVEEMGIDMLSVSGHKIHAPKGIGFLYKKECIHIEPLIHGGHQEFGYRAGTENVPYIMGLAKAVEIAKNKNFDEMISVRNYMINELLKIPQCKLNGSRESRLPNNINVSFKDIDGESLMLLLNMSDIYVSNGSACNAGYLSSSEVLNSMEVPSNYSNGTIRMTIDEDFTKEDADFVIGRIKESVKTLRNVKGK